MPSQIRIQVYICDTPQLCKSIWSLTVSQHQFYLDQKTLNKVILDSRIYLVLNWCYI